MAANQTLKPLEMYDLVHNTAIMLGKPHLKKFLKEFGTRSEYAAKVEAL